MRLPWLVLTPAFFAIRQYVRVRRSVVNLLAKVAEMLRLDSETVHYAMVYMDRHQASVVETRGFRLLLTGLACLVVATKYLEPCHLSERGVPSCPSLAHFVVALQRVGDAHPLTGLTPKHLAAYELRALQVLGWRLRVATPISYAHAYRRLGIFDAGDATDAEGSPLVPEERRHAWKYVEFFCDLATQRGMCNEYGVAIAAGASVAAARKLIGVETPWPVKLEQRFHHRPQDIEPCMRAMLQAFRVDFPAHFPFEPTSQEARPEACATPRNCGVHAVGAQDQPASATKSATVAHSLHERDLVVGATLQRQVNAAKFPSSSGANPTLPGSSTLAVPGMEAQTLVEVPGAIATPPPRPKISPTNVDCHACFDAAPGGWSADKKRQRDIPQSRKGNLKSMRTV